MSSEKQQEAPKPSASKPKQAAPKPPEEDVLSQEEVQKINPVVEPAAAPVQEK